VVPWGASDGPIVIEVQGFRCSNSEDFDVLSSEIAGFSPPSGRIGTGVTVTGKSLQQVSAVSFGDVPATPPQNISDTQFVTTVPPVASSEVRINAKVNGQTISSSANFHVLLPTITSFSPTSGKVGDSVTVNGKYLQEVDSLSFGNTSAIRSSQSDAVISTIVPAGASDGKITVGIQGKEFVSSSNFDVKNKPAKLTITQLGTEPSPPSAGKAFEIIVVCHNGGELPSDSVTVRLSVRPFDDPNQFNWGPVEHMFGIVGEGQDASVRLQVTNASSISLNQTCKVVLEFVSPVTNSPAEYIFSPNP